MCEQGRNYKDSAKTQLETNQASNALGADSHMVYELKQKREYLLRQIIIVQQAIDAVNLTSNF